MPVLLWNKMMHNVSLHKHMFLLCSLLELSEHHPSILPSTSSTPSSHNVLLSVSALSSLRVSLHVVSPSLLSLSCSSPPVSLLWSPC